LFEAVQELSSKGSCVQYKNVLKIQYFAILCVETGGGKKSSSEEFHNLYFWPEIIRLMKSNRM